MEYWIWLQLVLGYGNGRFPEIIERFGSAKEIYSADRKTLSESGLFTPSEINRMRKISLSKGNDVLKSCKNAGISVVAFGSKDYPECLANISSPPVVLYYKGIWPDFDGTPSVCIVGSRKCSEYGIKASYSLALRLAKGGMLIVSGGAVGVDAAAHKGAIAADGVTVAVLACGIGFEYLKTNENLREKIMQHGCIVSEYPPMYPLKKGAFQIRNRLMPSLSLGTAVVEAAEHSGALITVNHALEQGKDVFVIPGNPSLQYLGSNRLLQDGAKPLLSAMDIFNEYIGLYNDKLDIEKAYAKNNEKYEPEKLDMSHPEKKQVAVKPQVCTASHSLDEYTLSDDAIRVYRSFSVSPLCLDELSCSSDMNAMRLMSAVTELEIFGLLHAVPGGRYLRIKLKGEE